MKDLSGIIKNTVSITQFNRGLAGQIFESVKKDGAKVVIKNNNPECVLLSPEEYLELMEEINDLKLMIKTNERLSTAKKDELISEADIEKEYGFNAEDLGSFKDVELDES